MDVDRLLVFKLDLPHLARRCRIFGRYATLDCLLFLLPK